MVKNGTKSDSKPHKSESNQQPSQMPATKAPGDHQAASVVTNPQNQGDGQATTGVSGATAPRRSGRSSQAVGNHVRTRSQAQGPAQTERTSYGELGQPGNRRRTKQAAKAAQAMAKTQIELHQAQR